MGNEYQFVKFTEALKRVDKSPCEKYLCKKKNECAKKKLACQSFVKYVKTGFSHSPVIGINGEFKKEIENTRELFNQAMDNDFEGRLKGQLPHLAISMLKQASAVQNTKANPKAKQIAIEKAQEKIEEMFPSYFRKPI